MIIYDENFNILGMGAKALGFLEFSSLEEFLQTHKDISEFILGYDNNKENIISYLLSLPSRSKKVHLRSRSGKLLIIIISANEISHKTGQKLYELDMHLEERLFDDEIHTRQSVSLSTLRLPQIFSEYSKMHKTTQKQDIIINDEWLKQANSKLNLTKDEFLDYLKIFVQSANKIDISLQNFLTAHDYAMIKKVITRLKEPALNLHITPLVQIYNTLLNSNTANYNEILASSRECINALANLLQQQTDKK